MIWTSSGTNVMAWWDPFPARHLVNGLTFSHRTLYLEEVLRISPYPVTSSWPPHLICCEIVFYARSEEVLGLFFKKQIPLTYCHVLLNRNMSPMILTSSYAFSPLYSRTPFLSSALFLSFWSIATYLFFFSSFFTHALVPVSIRFSSQPANYFVLFPGSSTLSS